MNTREAIISAALRLLTANLPLPSSSSVGSLPFQAGSDSYDFNLASELSKYAYAFSFEPYALNTPIELDTSIYPAPQEGSTYRYYTKPADTGELFVIIRSEDVEAALSLVIQGKSGIQNQVSYTPVGNNLIQVVSEDDNLFLLYTNLNPSPLRMSAPFKNGLRYSIAADLLPHYKDARGARTADRFRQESVIEFSEAKRIDEYSNSKQQQTPTLDDILLRGSTDGRIGYSPADYY